MILTPKQINSLLEIIDSNQAMVIGREFGLDFLSDQDVDLLKKYGININTLYSFSTDTVFTSFHFGLLVDALEQIQQVNNVTFKDLFDYISEGNYIPLTTREISTINSIKTQSLASLRGVGNKIFQDVNQILQNNSRKEQEEFIKKEIERGVTKKKTIRQIANEISRKTGDWSRDFDRIVQYVSQTAFEHGKAAAIIRKYGNEVYVYKKVYKGACKHCIRLYLTKGLGSEPKVFKLSELISNGSNIGKKVADWLPTLDPIHPYCRCSLVVLSSKKTFIWNLDKKEFDNIDLFEKRIRPKVKAIVGGKKVYV